MVDRDLLYLMIGKTLLSLGLASLLAPCELFASENLISNGDFAYDRQTLDWEGIKFSEGEVGEAGFVSAPEMISWVDEGFEGNGGALKVSIKPEPGFVYKANQTGARALLKAGGTKEMGLMVTFAAKSLSGSPFLYITRFTGGGAITQPIELSKDWRKYEAIFPLTEDATLLVFNLVGSEDALESLQGPSPITPDLAEGEFLLDEVTVTPEPMVVP